jgi:GMP synthase (glutamine-hydrolysing)
MILFVQNDPAVPAGRYAQLLDAWQVPCATWRPDRGASPPDFEPLAGVLVLGGYMGVHDGETCPCLATVRTFMAGLLARDIPLLGICLGGQLLAAVLGGEVRSGVNGEHGCRPLQLTAAGQVDPLFAGLPPSFPVFQWHNDSFGIPPGAIHLAFSADCPGQVVRSARAWCVQFHPEVTAAIVAAWVRKSGAGTAGLTEFLRREKELAVVAESLLRNFLTIAGLTGADC